MSHVVCEVTSQSESNWRTRRRLTSQGDRYPIGEVEAGFGIEALMVGSGIEGDGGSSGMVTSNGGRWLGTVG